MINGPSEQQHLVMKSPSAPSSLIGRCVHTKRIQRDANERITVVGKGSDPGSLPVCALPPPVSEFVDTFAASPSCVVLCRTTTILWISKGRVQRWNACSLYCTDSAHS
jgi:hypothetical protein